MNNNELTRKLAKQAELFLRRNGPTILTVVGVGGFIASNVMTAKATTKTADKRKEFGLKLQEAKEDEYESDRDRTKRIAEIFFRDGAGLLKDYAPAIAVGSVSIVCVITAHNISQKRQAALLAAYSAMDRSFKAYRARVAKELGAEKELELYRNPDRLPPREGDDETLPCEIDYSADLPSMYARVFDELNPNWTKTSEYNLFFLKTQETWANDRLKAHGFLFLNEVLEALGFPRTQIGQIVGWKVKKDGTNDGYVDFGILSVSDDVSRAFVNGLENCVLLDFNVDGPISI
jgi:uncharacterized protein DUF6353